MNLSFGVRWFGFGYQVASRRNYCNEYDEVFIFVYLPKYVCMFSIIHFTNFACFIANLNIFTASVPNACWWDGITLLTFVMSVKLYKWKVWLKITHFLCINYIHNIWRYKLHHYTLQWKPFYQLNGISVALKLEYTIRLWRDLNNARKGIVPLGKPCFSWQ